MAIQDFRHRRAGVAISGRSRRPGFRQRFSETEETKRRAGVSLSGPRSFSGVAIQLSGLLPLVQDEDNFQVGFVALDVAILDHHVHVLDMSPLDISQGASGTL